MVAQFGALATAAIESGFAEKAGKIISSGGKRRTMGGAANDDLVSFAGRGGVGDPNDPKQSQKMKDELTGEVATKGISMLGPKGMIAAKIIETIPGGKKLVGKIVNGVIDKNPVMKLVGGSDAIHGFKGMFSARSELKSSTALKGAMVGPSIPGLAPPSGGKK
jgi:hypothetical protein